MCICAEVRVAKMNLTESIALFKMSERSPCGTCTFNTLFQSVLGREHQRRIPPARPLGSQGLFHGHTELQASAFTSTVTGERLVLTV